MARKNEWGRRLRGRLPLARPRLAAKEQRLAGDGGNHRQLKRLGDEERRLRPLSGEEALGISGDEDDRHFERREQLVHRVEAGAAVRELNIGEDEARPFLTGGGRATG